jgi:hypothetical protein
VELCGLVSKERGETSQPRAGPWERTMYLEGSKFQVHGSQLKNKIKELTRNYDILIELENYY